MKSETFQIHWRSRLGKGIPQYQRLGLKSIHRTLWCTNKTCLALFISINASLS